MQKYPKNIELILIYAASQNNLVFLLEISKLLCSETAKNGKKL